MSGKNLHLQHLRQNTVFFMETGKQFPLFLRVHFTVDTVVSGYTRGISLSLLPEDKVADVELSSELTDFEE